MFKILNGREHFYQWDLDQILILDDKSITQVHFCNRTDDCALVCEAYELDGMWVVNVPNILLQDNWRIRAYAWDGSATLHEKKFDVVARSKPESYVYTETEVLNYDVLLERMENIEQNLGETVENYLKENPVEVPVSSVNGKTGAVVLNANDVGAHSKAYINGEISALNYKIDKLSGSGAKVEVAESLDMIANPDENTIYFIRSNVTGVNDEYVEYMYINDMWEQIGVSQNELTSYARYGYIVDNYAKKSDLNSYAKKTDIPDHSVYALKSEIPTVPDVSAYQTADQVNALITSALGAIGVAEEGAY